MTNQITYDDEKLKYCYQHFRDNVSDIIQVASNSGARTILCTVPTNIRACAPFGSKHKDGLTKEQNAEWNKCFHNGRELELSGDFQNALANYEKSRAIDDVYAELSFCMGKCLYALGKTEQAKREFIKARDLDTLRFRADSQINSIIRELGKKLGNHGVTLLDLEEYLEKRAGHSSLGEDFLLDHVHLNFRGNFLAASWAMQVIKEMLPEVKLRNPEHSEDELLELCRVRLLYDENEQYRLAMDMYRRKTLPPFADRLTMKRRWPVCEKPSLDYVEK